MKKQRLIIYVFLVILAAVAFAACGSSSGGGVIISGGGTPAGTFTKYAEMGSLSNSWPFNDSKTLRVQMVYLASNIKGSGHISGFSFVASTGEVVETVCNNVTVKLGHTTDTALTNTTGTDSDYALAVEQGAGSYVPVLDDRKIVFPVVGAGEDVRIDLGTEFYYNGKDNLVLEVESASMCDNTLDIQTGTPGGIRRLADEGTDVRDSLNIYSVKFHFSGGVNEVVSEDRTGNASILPRAPSGTGRVQTLLFASDIDGEGEITGIAFDPASTTALTNVTDLTIRLAHVDNSITELASNFATNLSNAASVSIVTNSISYQVPDGMSDHVWIPFTDETFMYNGTGNLLVDIIANVTYGGYNIAYAVTPGVRYVHSQTMSAIAGSTLPRAYEPLLRFRGGTMDIVPPLTGLQTAFTHTVNNQIRQNLNRTVELGAAGTINRIAFRLASAGPTVSTVYTNFKVEIGHTTMDSLSSTFADNMDDAKVVFNGNYSIPAGLIEGDWIEIPLTSSFIYNGAGNLVTTFSTDAGSNAYNMSLSAIDATLYPGQAMGNTDRTSPTGTPSNYKVASRIWLK